MKKKDRLRPLNSYIHKLSFKNKTNKIRRFILLSLLISSLIIHTPIRNKYISLLEEKPLSEATIHKLEQYSHHFSFYANKYNIPKEVLMACVGSEINRRIYINKWIDSSQDYFFSTDLCSNFLLDKCAQSGIEVRYINFFKQDIGIGSIQVETAWNMRTFYPNEFEHINSKKEMVDYLLTIQGNIHVASIVVMHGKNLFEQYLNNPDTVNNKAVLFSYYKQGNSYYKRYLKKGNLKRSPIPGGGEDIIKKVQQSMP